AGWSAGRQTNCGSRWSSTRTRSPSGTRSGLPSTSCTKATSRWPSATMRRRALAETSMCRVGSCQCRRSRRSQPARARLAVEPMRNGRPPTAAARASLTRERNSATRGRARLSTSRPSGVGRQPVRARTNRAPPSSCSMRRSCVLNEGCATPSWRAARCRLPVSAMAHSALRCLTSSSMSWEGKAEVQLSPDIQMPTDQDHRAFTARGAGPDREGSRPGPPGRAGQVGTEGDRAALSAVAIITTAVRARTLTMSDSSPHLEESSMRMRMPLSVLTAAGLSLATLGLGTAGPAAAPPTAEGAPVVAYDGTPSAGSPADAKAEAAANRAFFEAVLRSVAEKRAANPKSTAAVTVVYNASGAPSFATQIARSTQIWNSSVSNVRLQAGSSGADFTYREGNDPRGSYASTDGHGRGYIFLDYRQNQTYDSTRVTAHETGHVLGLPDHYSGPCSELMSG